MSYTDEDIKNILKNKEGELLEYKAVLPPSKTIAQLICAFANAKGGMIVLGATENELIGLSSDFNVNSIVAKAINMLVPQPEVEFEYAHYKGKTLYIINVVKSNLSIVLENFIYVREKDQITSTNLIEPTTASIDNEILKKVSSELKSECDSTAAKNSFVTHYYNIINILQKIVKQNIYDEKEQQILLRILFSSCADNFETYMSDILFEIYLAEPLSLKSNEQITVKEVLDCNDLNEFIVNFARKKISKLQRGSVKGFLDENKQISAFKVIEEIEQNNIEKILQIRHLFAHRNGIIDEKFQKYFSDTKLGELFLVSVEQIAEKLITVVKIVNKIDKKAIEKYSLSIYS